MLICVACVQTYLSKFRARTYNKGALPTSKESPTQMIVLYFLVFKRKIRSIKNVLCLSCDVVGDGWSKTGIT
jgi:hypothetical protein